jgi:hypothetical protein
MGWLQSSPPNEPVHAQVWLAVQVPCEEQLFGQLCSAHEDPLQPGKHAHVPFWHCPLPWQSPSQATELQSSPANFSKQ